MRKFLHMILALLGLTLISACTKDKDPQTICEEQQSGVCVVLNSYYYEIILPNGNKWFCKGIDEEGDLDGLTFDESEILKNKAMTTGTAFFIDNNGTLLTNRHVVNPIVSEETIKTAAGNLISAIGEYIQAARIEYAQQYQSLEDAKQECYSYDYWGHVDVNKSRLCEIEAAQQELSNQFNEASEMASNINQISLSAIRVVPQSEIGIAYNNTFVTDVDDFLKKNPCVVVKTSKDEDVDLAKIQLKDKRTPEGKYVFKIKGIAEEEKNILNVFNMNKDKDGQLKIGTNLLMIGFNAGLILGNTQQGIQAQMTKGEVTQTPDGSRVLYSIPTLQGSSGSPVIDYQGYVRAVNFAKLKGTDTFNFGIPEKKIIQFLEY